MLPFLKNKEGSVSEDVNPITRNPDDDTAMLRFAAIDIISAIRKGSVEDLVESLKAFCDIRDSEPHLEGPH